MVGTWCFRPRDSPRIADGDRGPRSASALRVRVRDGGVSGVSLSELCEVCAEVTDLQVSIALSSGGAVPVAVAASAGAAAIEELQLTLGEGPSIDAQADGRPVLIDDVRMATGRWPQFMPAATALGLRAVYAYPLQVGVIRTGVLALYADHPHPLADGGTRDLAALAGLVTDAVLAMQSIASAGDLSSPLLSSAEHPAAVHQATGMVSVQLACSVEDAFARLQAKAFADDVGVTEVARRVVGRELRFEP